jgi:RNA polymerase sigma factor (sigma-70 family)
MAAIRRAGYRLCDDDHADIAQDVMLEAWQNFEPKRTDWFPWWIARLGRFRTIDAVRRRARQATLKDEHFDRAGGDEDHPAEALDDRWRKGARHVLLNGAIERLAPGFKEVVILFRQGLRHAEIAKKLGISPENARVRLSRALKEMRRTVASST